MSKFKKNIFYSFVSIFGSKFLGIISLIILSKIVTKEDLGIFTAIFNSIDSLTGIALLGIPFVLHIKVAKLNSEKNQNEIEKKVIGSVLVVLIVVIILSIVFIIWNDSILNFLLKENAKRNYSIILIVATLFNSLAQLPNSILMGYDMFSTYAKRTVVVNFIYLVIIPLFFLLGNLHFGLIGIIVYYFIAFVFSWLLILKHFNNILFKYKLKSILTSLKDVFKQSFLFFIGNNFFGAIQGLVLTGFFVSYIDIDFLTYIRFGGALSTLVMILPAAFNQVSTTFLAQKSSIEETLKFKAFQIKLLVSVSFLVIFIIICNIKTFISVLFSSKYLDGQEVIVFQLYTIMLIMVAVLIANFLSSQGYIKITSVISIVCSIIYLLLTVTLMPLFKLNGYYVSYLVTYIINLSLLVYFERKYSKYNSDVKKIVLLLLILLFFGVIAYFISKLSFFYILILSIFSMSTFFVLIKNYVFDINEVNLIKNTYAQLKSKIIKN